MLFHNKQLFFLLVVALLGISQCVTTATAQQQQQQLRVRQLGNPGNPGFYSDDISLSNMTMTSVDDMSSNMTSVDDVTESSESSHDMAESSHDAVESSNDAMESSHDAVESSHDSSHDLADDYENCKTDELKSIRGVACSNKDIYNTMCDLLKAVDTDYALASGLFTAFFPTDDAFAAIAAVTNTLSDEQMSTIVKFHIHEGDSLTYEELACQGLLDMATGKTSRTKCDDGKRYQNGPGNHESETFPMIMKNSSDIVTCNGIVHTIDAVMLPKLSGGASTSEDANQSSSSSSSSVDTAAESDDDSSTDMSNVTFSKRAPYW